MEIQEIVDRYAEGFSFVDQSTQISNQSRRTGEIYLPGLKTLTEKQAVEELDSWWATAYPSEFPSPSSHQVDIPLPGAGRNRCDHIFTTDGNLEHPEWGVEVKRLELVGQNGKDNGYTASKGLSPYLKDRSLYHDILKLRDHPVARRLAVIAYGFTYDEATCEKSLELHPQEGHKINEIRKLCRTNGGTLRLSPVVDFAEGIFMVKELISRQASHAQFEAWRHPCGGRGVVFGWEIRRQGSIPELENW